jgi:hypothetical protein
VALASLSNVAIVRGHITQPFSGLWHADLLLASATDVSGPQTLLFAGVAWSCAYIRAIDFSGERGVRVVAGRGGWRTTIPGKQYGAAGIFTRDVVNDAAAACGEPPPTLDPTIPPTVGSAWLRGAGPASDTLQRILGGLWWVDKTGVVQTSPRAGSVASPFQAMAVAGASGIYEIATDNPNEWQPGVSFSGPTVSGVVSRVMHVIEPDKLRLEVMVP